MSDASTPADSVRVSPGGTKEAYDLIVLGSGGAGMATALFGAIDGLKVLLIEKTDYLGGTTAMSGGVAWIPNTHLAKSVNGEDSIEKAATYLRNVVGNHVPEALQRSFLENGPKAVEKLELNSDVKFRAFPYHPDYQSDQAGATMAGRALESLPFDGRRLGKDFSLLRPPMLELTVLGGMMVDRIDVGHLLKITKSWESCRYSLRILLRHARDRLTYPRGTRLVMGNALIARMLQSLRQRNVEIWTDTALADLIVDGRRAVGVVVERSGRRRMVRAERGIVLATGGFNRNPALRAKLLPSVPTYTPGAPGHTGDAIELALKFGAQLGMKNFDNALWAPVSVRSRADGSTAVYPHFIMDRGKPGTVVVNKAGKRFLNETLSYHLFGHTMVEANATSPCIPAFLIADQRALRKYGLGMIRPGGRGIKPFVDEGYLVIADTIGDLARKLDIEAAVLEATVRKIKEYAFTGVDEEFGRGTTEYQRNLGDPSHEPNPTIGALVQPPYYAVRLYPGDIGASTGLMTDEMARVLNKDGKPIPGLYAVGNDMNSIMGGAYPGPGITLGPGITFAYLVAVDAAKQQPTRSA